MKYMGVAAYIVVSSDKRQISGGFSGKKYMVVGCNRIHCKEIIKFYKYLIYSQSFYM